MLATLKVWPLSNNFRFCLLKPLSMHSLDEVFLRSISVCFKVLAVVTEFRPFEADTLLISH